MDTPTNPQADTRLASPIRATARAEVSRRRVKKACASCVRKKLKCDGLHPCATCVPRNIPCTYTNLSTVISRAKLRQNQNIQNSHPTQSGQHALARAASPHISNTDLDRETTGTEPNVSSLRIRPLAPRPTSDTPHESNHMEASETQNGSSGNNSETNEGEVLNEQSRLLNDGKGRLLYLGDSASLSFLDTVRRLVESTLGPSGFTKDANRLKILEGSISVDRKPIHVLPDREAAEFLIDSFFSNTVGILYILDREACAKEMAQIYENPLQAEQSRLSIFNLIFAVGLQMTRSSAAHSFRESQILKRLDAGPMNCAELFYLNATHLKDPMHGFEDGDITSIQALLLITVFMLTVAKRNAAWAYFGMAVRSAYALGLHRKQTTASFPPAEQEVRKNVWKSLYVIDCFLSAMLGRPNGITTRDAPDTSSFGSNKANEEPLEALSLTAALKASRLLGNILESVYAERKISVKLAHQISAKFESWKASLPSTMHWENIGLPNEDPRLTLAQLHVNLAYFHGVILLTRPFLLQKIISTVRVNKAESNVLGSLNSDGRETGRASAEPFPPACIRSAVYTINAVQSALLKRALPRRDPFVIYWLFSAALIIFSNKFVTVCTDVDISLASQTALSLHKYLGEVDPLARRYAQILVAFDEAIATKDNASNGASNGDRRNESVLNAFFGSASLHDSQVPSLDFHAIGPSAPQSGVAVTPGLQVAPEWQSNTHASPLQNNTFGAQLLGPVPGTGISPPDYSLDFDAFLSSLNQEPTHAQDLWMPLYESLDFP